MGEYPDNSLGAGLQLIAQVINADPQQWMRSKGPRLDSQPHRHRRRVPARGGEPLQQRLFGRRLIEVVGLGIELRREALDVFARHQLLRTLEPHPDT